MTRARAWTISIIATGGLLALVFGIGANTGQFGFQQGGTSAEAQAGSPGDGIVSHQPSAAGFDDDREGYEGHEGEDDGDHEGDDHEAYEDDEHEDDHDDGDHESDDHEASQDDEHEDDD